MPSLYNIRYAHCGLSAAIPHADTRTYTLRTRVRHAEGMR